MPRLSAVLLTAVLLSGCAASRPTEPAQDAPARGAAAQQAEKKSPYKPYGDVITGEAVSDAGLFGVHRVGSDYFFEIPDSLLGREMLLISRIAQTPANLSPFINAGSKVGEQVVRWERRGEQVLLRRMAYESVASDSLPVARSVRANNFEPIVHAFAVAALTPDSAGVVIQVNDFFEKDVPAISGLSPSQRTRFKVRRLDDGRSFIDAMKSFPLNVNVRHTMTFEAGEPPSNADTGTLSMQLYQSMVLLPEEPMRGRLADPRVGYFTVEQIDFGSPEQKAATRAFIRRWRLEPSDPAAYARGELVAPVTPIVYYLDPATPERWRPYFCRGVEDWNAAFEAAGFRDAIRCELPPVDDPDFDPEDVRYSTVRYVANTTRNAVGPSVSDPRSGEIIESDIIWYHNHIRSYRNRLMIETGAANPEARSLMLPDDLIGETMRQVIAHEIGHALGLPHNMIASSAYPVDSLRSPTFTAAYGVAPTIMDYARQNYIAQPGDGVERFIRKIGPYDHYAIEWGYRHYADAATPEAEKPALDRLIRAHEGDPRYRYLGYAPYNPDAQTEDLGDDPVAASTYAVANLQRVVPRLIDWTATPGKDYGDLDEIYGELLGQWYRYMNHVTTVVGGVYQTPKASDQDGPVFEPVPRAQQEAALAFLTAHVFETPTWLNEPALLRRIEHAGAVDRLRARQVALLNNLLDPQRMQRLIEAEAVDGGAYPLVDFMEDVKDGVWTELDAARPAIGTYRRNLQRGYLERMAYLMTEEIDSPFVRLFGTPVDVSQSDIRAVVRGQLKALRAEARRAAARAADAATRYHLDDAADRIDALLDPDA
ncbi:MAG: zinc-dependent metalloprotease [Rhodothermales bacterium]|nr:zinc-dependent metalloprotease [Rhodothermales bacterium]